MTDRKITVSEVRICAEKLSSCSFRVEPVLTFVRNYRGLNFMRFTFEQLQLYQFASDVLVGLNNKYICFNLVVEKL